ncbi:nucleoside phosphorylase domain-containing protein [Sporodiniella umbellata]|nr:nucleoside phosphorylase domain-containing protein [Sporodiniella umbellata]
MKDTILEANFPRDAEGKVYHLGLKQGQIANRILTTGDPARAWKIATLLDSEKESGHPLFECMSPRGILTYTGRYRGVPISIIAIGMGQSMMDFLIREGRAITKGTLAVVRFGSCGSWTPLARAGAVIVPRGGYCIRRNLDYFADTPLNRQLQNSPYLFSGVFPADKEITDRLKLNVQKILEPLSNQRVGPVLAGGLNADACSFYSSQGRTDSNFWDDNHELPEQVSSLYPETHSMEMESSTLFQLARCSRIPIRAASCMYVIADRINNAFARPECVNLLEPEVGRACLETLIETKIEDEMESLGTVWERPDTYKPW